MAKLQKESLVNKSPGQLAEILCSEDFLVSIEKPREEVVDAEYRLVEKNDDRTVFEIAVTGYKHDKKGNLDKSGTNTNVAEYCWDHARQTLTMQYKGSGRIAIAGAYRLQPQAGGTRLSYEATVDVSIPLIGKFVAGRISKEMQKSFDTVVSKLNCQE